MVAWGPRCGLRVPAKALLLLGPLSLAACRVPLEAPESSRASGSAPPSVSPGPISAVEIPSLRALDPCPDSHRPWDGGGLAAAARELRLAPPGVATDWTDVLTALREPGPVTYLRGPGNSEVVAIACFDQPRNRQRALQRLAARTELQDWTFEPWRLVSAARTRWLIVVPLDQVLERLSGEADAYFELSSGPPVIVSRGRVRPPAGGDALVPPAINQHQRSRKFFRRALRGRNLPTAAQGPDPTTLQPLRIAPADVEVVLPFHDLEFRMNASTDLTGLEIDWLSSAPDIHGEVRRDPPRRLRPGIPRGVSVKFVALPGALPGEYPFVLGVGGKLSDRDGIYESFVRIRTIVDRAPAISGPSSAEVFGGARIPVEARDRSGRPVHLEALLPSGAEFEFGPQGAHLVFSPDQRSGVPSSRASITAWAGMDRDRSWVASHALEILGGDIWPPPRTLILLLACLGAVGLVFALLGRRYSP